ncbi:glutaredoxin family protein [Micrococcoides hystricis]|uniref:Glutaredoxin family protein n=1 Tax=Micrococcoides hystricis TaxID=1572761 RepID=A0ABV6PD76_9MICC
MSITSPVVLLSKDGCHLCADAAAELAPVCEEFDLQLSIEQLDDHPELVEQYWQMLPVLLVDGVQRDFLKISPDRVRKLLSARSSANQN